MDEERVIGVRDPHGFRPLVLGRLPSEPVVSEVVAQPVVTPPGPRATWWRGVQARGRLGRAALGSGDEHESD